MLHGVQQLTAVLKDMPSFTVDAKLQDSKDLPDTLEHWAGDTVALIATTDLPRQILSTRNQRSPRVPKSTPVMLPDPRVQRLGQQSPPRVQPISTGEIPSNHQPIDQRLRSQSAPKQLDPNAATYQPVAHHTRSRTTQQALRVQPVLTAQRKYPTELISLWCNPITEEHTEMPILDNETGE